MRLTQLFSDASKWTKGHGARTQSDAGIFYDSPEACKWCLVGGVAKCYFGSADYQEALECVRMAIKKLFPGFPTVISFNDHKDTTFEDVVKVIKLAEERHESLGVS